MYSVIKDRFLRYINSLEFTKEQKRVLDLIKAPHTDRVVEISEVLASTVFDDKEQIGLSKIIAVLHDIARWEQVRKYDSFSDAVCDHGDLGVEIVENINILDGIEEKYKEIILISVKEHNKKYSRGYGGLTQMFVDIIKDADRIDNFYIEVENFGYSADPSKKVESPFLKENRLSVPVFESVMNEELIDSKIRETVIDYRFSKMAWCFDLKLQKSFEIVHERKYIEAMFNDIENPDKKMRSAYEKIKSYVESGLSLKRQNQQCMEISDV